MIERLIVEGERKIQRALKRLADEDAKAAIAISVSEVTQIFIQLYTSKLISRGPLILATTGMSPLPSAELLPWIYWWISSLGLRLFSPSLHGKSVRSNRFRSHLVRCPLLIDQVHRLAGLIDRLLARLFLVLDPFELVFSFGDSSIGCCVSFLNSLR